MKLDGGWLKSKESGETKKLIVSSNKKDNLILVGAISAAAVGIYGLYKKAFKRGATRYNECETEVLTDIGCIDPPEKYKEEESE